MSNHRKKNHRRCASCGLHHDMCACSELPELVLETQVVVVQHSKEIHKPTNTVRLLTRMVPSVRVLPYAPHAAMFDPEPLSSYGSPPFLVFPGPESTLFTPEVAKRVRDERRPIVLLDGTWHQCSRMARRLPGVRDLETISLPVGAPSRFTRTQHRPEGLSTLEAALRVLESLEPVSTTTRLRDGFHLVAARAAFTKGRLDTPEVPASWHEA